MAQTNVSLSEYAFQEIKKGIEIGLYCSGEKLSERHLARQLNVSHTPVRNAVRRLRSLGLVQTRDRSGTYVCNISSM